MGYIDSANIKVFPTTQRQTQDASARMMTEYNLTSIINRLVDKKCFVISSDTLDSDGYFVIDNSRFEFNLFGYYFSIESIDKILNSITELNNKAKRKDSSVGAVLFSNDDVDSSKLAIVAEIKISGNEDTINNMSWQRLDGTDDSASGKYTGINFLLEPLSNYT